jgi:YidC/Oxa1 family membrane protein insertase
MQKWGKYLILLGIFVTAYLLILAWQKDYGHLAVDPAVSSPTVQNSKSTTDIPSVVASDLSTPVNSDIPPAAVVKPSPTVEPSVATSQGLVTLQTDMYRLLIDPKGGDVVRAELFKHLHADGGDKPFLLLEQGAGRVYTAQSGLIGADGPDAAATGRPLYKSAQSSYTLAANQKSLDIPFIFDAPNGVQIIKNFRITAGQYPVVVTYKIINKGATPWNGQMFGQVKRDSSKDSSQSSQGLMGMSTYLGGAWGTKEDHYNKLGFDDFQSEPLNKTAKGGWVAVLQHYFVTAWVPDASYDAVMTTRVSGAENFIGFTSPVVSVAPGAEQTISATLYAGPKVQQNLKPLATGLDQTVDYGWLWPIAQGLFLGLKLIHGVIGNWGWSIILLTLLVKIVLFPLSAKSYRSMAKMKVIAPEMQRLKEEHGEDRMKFSQEMMALYKKEGVNPLSGCMPILLQMPIFMSLYYVFMESVELRNAPWIGWITDLSAMDHWFVLPLIMGATMYFQQMLNPQPADPMQAKMLKMMPIIFTVFMLWFPSGLVLYWSVNNLLTIVQQRHVNRQIEKSYHPKVG